MLLAILLKTWDILIMNPCTTHTALDQSEMTAKHINYLLGSKMHRMGRKHGFLGNTSRGDHQTSCDLKEKFNPTPQYDRSIFKLIIN